MEIAAVENIPVHMIDHRIIIYRIEFFQKDSFSVINGIVYRSQNLGHTSQRIIFLHLIFKYIVFNIGRIIQMFRTAVDHFTVLQHTAHHGCNIVLTVMMLYNIQFFGIVIIISFHYFVGHGRKHD